MQWNATLYEQRHSFVWKYGEDLIALLDPHSGDRILDVGCGTGQLTARLAETGAEVTGLDSAAPMIDQARAACPGLCFLHADIAAFTTAEPFDGIFSNAALHWVRPPAQAAQAMFQALKPGGRLVAELGGAGNIASLLQAANEILGQSGEPADHPWYFPSIGEYSQLLEAAGFEVLYALLFDRVTPLEGGDAGLANWLGVFAPQWRASILNQLKDKLRPQLYDPQSDQWRMDYRRLRIAARRPL